MSVRAELVEQIGRYDDDSWVALANRGLLRRARKDLETVDVAVLTDGDDALWLGIGPHEVTFDARGPAHAACSCRSRTTCQHIVVAGLWLATSGDAAGDADVRETARVSASPVEGEQVSGEQGVLHQALMAMDVAALARHAGRAGLRWAVQYVADLEIEREVRIAVGRHVTIGLTSPRVTFRYMGGEVDGLVPDIRLPAVEKYQAAAALVYQRVHGAVSEPLPAPAVVPRSDDATLVESRERLRARTARLLVDTVALGVSHLSPAIGQRYQTAAVWAQGAEYYRLALVLRRLADHVELLLDRSARADEQRLLDEAAMAFALVGALDAAAAAGQAPQRLVGIARNRYQATRAMDLIGLGAVPWRAASGYRGLTAVFWWADEARFVSVTDARPVGLAGFDPRQRYRAPGPWAGLRSVEATTGARVRLTGAHVTVGGRISAVERTSATVEPLSGADLAAGLPVLEEWSALERRDGVGSLLDEPDPLADWVVLRPAVFERPVYDAAAQVLTWRVIDGSGAGLTLTTVYAAESAHLVARVESIGSSGGPGPGTLVVCRVRPGPFGLVGEPLSLIHPDRSALETSVEALHFAEPDVPAEVRPEGRRRHPHRERGRTRIAPSSSETVGLVPAASHDRGVPVVPRQLTDFHGWLVARAERGTGASSSAVVGAELARQHEHLRGVGLTVFRPLEPAHLAVDVAAQVLRSCYLAQQVTALLAGESAPELPPGSDEPSEPDQ